MSGKGILWTMLLASIAGMIAAFVIFPYTIYKYGAEARAGGARAYRKSSPSFLGLILGEYVVACGWALLGVIVGKPMYVVWV